MILAKNPTFLAGQSDNYIEDPGKKAVIRMMLANNCNVAWRIEFEFPNSLGAGIPDYTINFSGYDGLGVANTVTDYFVPHVVNVITADAVISQYFNISYIEFSSTAIVLQIEAKEIGEAFDMNALANFHLIGAQITTDFDIDTEGNFGTYVMYLGGDIVYRTNLVIQLTIQKYDIINDVWNTYTKLKCIPSSDNASFQFNVSGVLRSILKDVISLINPIPVEYAQFGLFRFVFDEIIGGVAQNTIYSLENYAILGASPQPNRFYDTNRFANTDKRVFLTNMPAKARFGRDFYFVNGFLLGNAFTYVYAYYQALLDGNAFINLSDNKSPEIKPYFFKYAQLDFARRFEDLLNLEEDLMDADECSVKMWVVHTNDTEFDATADNEIEVTIDLKKYRNNNYFLFTNAYGATDTAWLSGELEHQVEIENTRIEFHPVIDADFQQSQFGMYNKKGTQKFKISSGFKTIQEIQWLMELVFSEKVYWAPYNTWRTLIDIANNVYTFEGKDGPIPIIIDKQSVSFHKSNNTVNSFSFEFEIAADTFTPILNLI